MNEWPELPKRVPLREPRREPRLKTAEDMHKAIRRIMKRRLKRASESQYDVLVCVRSVDASNEVFESIPIEGTARDYGHAVMAAIDTLQQNYWDTEGEYTSKGMVGDVGSDIYRLLEEQKRFT